MEGHRQEKERKFPKKVIKGEKSRDFLRHRQNSLVKDKKSKNGWKKRAIHWNKRDEKGGWIGCTAGKSRGKM
jgi:hypothetical protein